MSNYKPMTADEAAKLSIRPDGIYAFEVLNATAAKSKEKGNDMIALELGFFDADGDRFSVKSWLVHSDSRWSEKTFFDFAATTGLAQKYAAGTMCAEDCLGRSGFAVIGTEKGKKKDNSDDCFPDKNKVKYFTTKKPETSASKPEPTEAQLANQAPKTGVDQELDSVPF